MWKVAHKNTIATEGGLNEFKGKEKRKDVIIGDTINFMAGVAGDSAPPEILCPPPHSHTANCVQTSSCGALF